MKPQMQHNGKNQISFHLIKSFLHIHLKKHESTFPSLKFEGMKKLMSNNSIVLYTSFWHKSELERGDDFVVDLSLLARILEMIYKRYCIG